MNAKEFLSNIRKTKKTSPPIEILSIFQIKKTKEKFEKWDKAVADEDPNMLELMEDPTIWAYANLIDRQGKSLRMYPYQDLIINDLNRLVQWCAARQIGKTTMLCVKALHHAAFTDNAEVIIVSKTETQSYRVLDEIKGMMRRSHIDFSTFKDEIENRTEMTIRTSSKNVSKITCTPPTESARGYPATLLLLDEVASWEGPSKEHDQVYLYEAVMEPMTAKTRNFKHIFNGMEVGFLVMGQIVACSTPNGMQGIFWKLWGDSDFSHYRFNFLINPENTEEEYEKKRSKMASDIFESEYGAEFTSTSGGFITSDEYQDALKENYDFVIPNNGLFYLGADFAGEDTKSRDTDFTVMVGVTKAFNQQKNRDVVKACYYKEFPRRIKKNEVYDEIKRLNDTYGIATFCYDKMGVGDSVRNDLIDKGILGESKIEPLTYSLPDKSNVYYNMKHLFEQRLILLRHNNTMREQLLGLRFEKTEGGHIKVHHLQESMHDDFADALANACWASRLIGSTTLIKAIPHKLISEMNDAKDENYKPAQVGSKVGFVECSVCTHDWKYDNEIECRFCHASVDLIVDYQSGIPIKEFLKKDD